MNADADFAGCSQTLRSTSGLHLAIRSPNTCFLISGQSKRQSCVSRSSRISGLPTLPYVFADYLVMTYGKPYFPQTQAYSA